MKNLLKLCFFLTFLLAASLAIQAQTKASKKPKKGKKTNAAVVTSTPQTVPQPIVATPPKKNERPAGDGPAVAKNSATVPVYFYEFTRPGFAYSRILIEHDEAGNGKIAFLKAGFEASLTDPLQLSPVTLAKINDALATLNFLESTESYQHARDYSHMGNAQITVKIAGRERTVKYNWTENKDAKMLMDEYRRIGNEYTWRFEITTARENQPLQTPGLMDTLDSYLKRSEISDPPHLLPFLIELSTDERLPLMARNHAAKLVKQIEKKKEDKK